MLLLKLAEEIVPFVVNQHKGGQIFDLHHPHRLHAQFGILKAAQAFHILLRQQSRRTRLRLRQLADTEPRFRALAEMALVS